MYIFVVSSSFRSTRQAEVTDHPHACARKPDRLQDVHTNIYRQLTVRLTSGFAICI